MSETDKDTGITSIRHNFSQVFIAYLWAHLIALPFASWFLDKEVWVPILSTIGVAGISTAFWLRDKTSATTRYVASFSLLFLVIVQTTQFSGHSWLPDANMYYFGALAFIVGWIDISLIISFAIMIGLHHLVANIFMPSLLYPGGSDFGRLTLHMAVLAMEAGALIGITILMRRSFKESGEALLIARKAEQETHEMHEQRQIEAQQVSAQRRQSRLELTTNFEQSVGHIVSNVNQSVVDLNQSASILHDVVRNVSSQSSEASTAMYDSLEMVQSMASAAEELAASIREITTQVTTSSGISMDAVGQAENANQTVLGLSEASSHIGDVITMIRDIADQTNLLALNATIEAARAGEAGKGFAVVASEVKNLAAQTSRATEDIESQVETIQQVTQQAVEAIDNILSIIRINSEISANISAAVEEQTSATAEIARNAQIAAERTKMASSTVGDMQQGVESTSQATANVVTATDDLYLLAEQLQNGTDHLIDSLNNPQSGPKS